MEWKIHKLKNLGSDCLASYSYGKVKGDVAFVLPDGKEYKDLNESDVVDYVKKSINTMADGSIKNLMLIILKILQSHLKKKVYLIQVCLGQIVKNNKMCKCCKCKNCNC